AAEHDHIGIDDVDDCSEGPGHAVLVARHRLDGRDIAGCGQCGDLDRWHAAAGASLVIASQTRSGEKGLDAPVLAAIARRPRSLVAARPWQRIVSPLPRDAIRSG